MYQRKVWKRLIINKIGETADNNRITTAGGGMPAGGGPVRPDGIQASGGHVPFHDLLVAE
jgi:hypothetical protein